MIYKHLSIETILMSANSLNRKKTDFGIRKLVRAQKMTKLYNNEKIKFVNKFHLSPTHKFNKKIIPKYIWETDSSEQ
jgi:hypothetical protein